MQLLKYCVQIQLIFFLFQAVQLQIFIIEQIKFPQRHLENFCLRVIQDLYPHIQQPGDVYRPVCTFGDSSSPSSSFSSGSGTVRPYARSASAAIHL